MNNLYKTLIFNALLFYPALLCAQREDNNWVGGFEETPHVPGFANYRIHFTASGIQVDTSDWGIPFESTTAAISDSSGNLILFTNGCSVFDAGGKVIPGGESLNPGALHDQVCERIGYIAPKGAVILPVPAHPGRFCILHMAATANPLRDLDLGPLYATWVDMNANGGKGAVTTANEPLASGALEPFMVVRHGNGRDWWVIVPRYGINRFSSFLLSPSGFQASDQDVGPYMSGRYNGSLACSLDGSRVVRFHPNQGALVLDFDRCTGQMSKQQFIPVPKRLLRGGGAAFSPKGDELYITSQSTLYVADLSAAAPKFDTVFYLFDNFTWGTTLQHLQYSPDQQLYAGTISRADYLNTIQFDAALHATALKFKSLKLPVMTARSLPNMPNFRLYDLPGSLCDTLGINAPTVAIQEAVDKSAFRSYPNPASEAWFLDIGSGHLMRSHGEIAVYNTSGQRVYRAQVSAGQMQVKVQVRDWPSGLYFWQMSEAGLPIAIGRLVKG